MEKEVDYKKMDLMVRKELRGIKKGECIHGDRIDKANNISWKYNGNNSFSLLFHEKCNKTLSPKFEFTGPMETTKRLSTSKIIFKK